MCGHKTVSRINSTRLKTTKSLTVNTIEAVGDEPGSSRTMETHMPNQAHTKAAEHHESAAKSHRAAAEFHGKNDRLKGNEHAAEAQKHSKVASGTSDAAHAKSSSQKYRGRGRGSARPSTLSIPLFRSSARPSSLAANIRLVNAILRSRSRRFDPLPTPWANGRYLRQGRFRSSHRPMRGRLA